MKKFFSPTKELVSIVMESCMVRSNGKTLQPHEMGQLTITINRGFWTYCHNKIDALEFSASGNTHFVLTNENGVLNRECVASLTMVMHCLPEHRATFARAFGSILFYLTLNGQHEENGIVFERVNSCVAIRRRVHTHTIQTHTSESA